MDLHSTIARLTRHPVFTEWHANNKEYFLAHAFVMLDETNKDVWQIGFYHPGKERMVTFIISPGSVEHTEEQEVLRSEGEITQLKPEDVTLSVEDALKDAKACLQEHYRGEIPIKEFFIIQQTEGHTLFNITCITQSFKTINIKIDSTTGKVLKHNIQSLAEFA